MKSIFHSFWRTIIWWKNKNLIKIVDTSFKPASRTIAEYALPICGILTCVKILVSTNWCFFFFCFCYGFLSTYCLNASISVGKSHCCHSLSSLTTSSRICDNLFSVFLTSPLVVNGITFSHRLQWLQMRQQFSIEFMNALRITAMNNW